MRKKIDMSKSARSRAAQRIHDRLIDELIGISRGVIADGVVDEAEAIFLAQWIENHRDIANRWPVNVVYARVSEMLQDGVLSDNEQADLLDTLRELTGDTSPLQEQNHSTALPLCRPAPEVVFDDQVFCLTGKFAYGSNQECEESILDIGGRVVSMPTQDTNYLVIGEFCSPDWIHTVFGRSIERAVGLRDQGLDLKIISERHWVDAMAVHG